MAEAAGEPAGGGLRLDFGRRMKLEFHCFAVTSDAGLLLYRELYNALGLTEMAGNLVADARTGRNGRRALIVSRRRFVFGRLAGLRGRD
jgi:hypothetical protein